jgi:HAD superfamily hydrolase (TIGR01549 family)
MIKAIIFDWGDTVMRDFPGTAGPMAYWEKVEWIPGAEEALKTLGKNYQCAIATNAGDSDTILMKKALERINALQYFSFFVSSKDLGVEKPSPEFFKKVASGLHLETSECIHIGNIYEKDITGAKEAGMKTIFFNERNKQGNYPSADKIIVSMNELTDAIRELDR